MIMMNNPRLSESQTDLTRKTPQDSPAETPVDSATDHPSPGVAAPMKPARPRSAATAARSARKMPTRTIINFWLDAGLLLLLAAHGTIAAIVYLIFPVGTAARGWTLWGMNYSQWCSLQFGALTAFAIAVLIHVMLHWTWVCSVISRNVLGRTEIPDNGSRTLYGVGLLIVLLHVIGGIVLLAQFTIQEPV